MEPTSFFYVVVGLIIFLALKGIKMVPQQQAWVVQTLGKFDRVLEPGLNFLIPFVQAVAYKHSLKEDAIDVQRQAAITKDNVTLNIDGVLYVKIIDPVDASYGVSDPYFAVGQLAQTTMRSEIGKITLDKTFEEREMLNVNIVQAINEASKAWGIKCMRYEIKDIEPPRSVLEAMELQVAAERKKRALVLESEGKRDAEINGAQGHKQRVVLESEAAMTDQINRARGEAEAIRAVADANADGITKVASALTLNGGDQAAALKVAGQYIEAFRELAQESTTILLPANANNAGAMVAEAMTIFNTINSNRPGSGPSFSPAVQASTISNASNSGLTASVGKPASAASILPDVAKAVSAATKERPRNPTAAPKASPRRNIRSPQEGQKGPWDQPEKQPW